MGLVLVHAVRLRRNAGVGGNGDWGHGGIEKEREQRLRQHLRA